MRKQNGNPDSHAFFCSLSFLAIYFEYMHPRKWPNFFLPSWHVAHILTHVNPNHWPMSSGTAPLCPISDITAVVSSKSISISIFKRLFIYKFEIPVAWKIGKNCNELPIFYWMNNLCGQQQKSNFKNLNIYILRRIDQSNWNLVHN